MSTAHSILCLGHALDRAPDLLRLALASAARDARIQLIVQRPAAQVSRASHQADIERMGALCKARYPRAVEVHVRIERPLSARAITHEMAQAGHDLLIKDQSQESGSGLWLIDDDAQLLRSCQGDVWFVNAEAALRIRRVVAAVAALPEGGYLHRSTTRLDRRVLKRAARLAHRLETGLHVVSAWHLLEEPGREPNANGVMTTYDERLAALRQRTAHEHEHRMRQLAARALRDLPGTIRETLPVTYHQQDGLPAEVINGQLNPNAADLLTIGQGARRRIHDLLGRSLADTLRLAHAGATLVVKSGSERLVWS